ncbi:MAG: V-type ATP synthase subunit E [Chloroflexaceae bacterium]
MPRISGDLSQLETTIKHAGRGEANTRMQEAEARAERIREEAREEADNIRTDLVRQARAEAEQQRRRQRSEAAQHARRDYLLAREELLAQVWQQAEQRLRQLPDDAEAYAETLCRLTWRAVQTLGSGRLRLAADAKGHELLTGQRLEEWSQAAGEEFDAAVTLERADEPIDTWGGLVVTDTEKRRRVDATFATRLAVARDELRDTLFQDMVQNA